MTTIQFSRVMKVTAAAFALAGATGMAVAQGTPPTTTSPDPATAAGQQTQQGTPMGTTGTPATNQGAAAAPGTPSEPTSSPSTAASDTTASEPMRTARADRN